MTGNKSSKAKRDARSEVLAAAALAFRRDGFSATSIDRIAQEAGVSKPTIYNHFTSKADLFTEILEEACKGLTTPMLEEKHKTGPLRAQLVRIAKAYVRSLIDPDLTALYRLVMWESERFPEQAHRYFDSGPERAYSVFADFLSSRMETGEIKEGNPRQLAELFGSLVVAPLRLRVMFAKIDRLSDAQIDEHCEAAVDLFLNGATQKPDCR